MQIKLIIDIEINNDEEIKYNFVYFGARILSASTGEYRDEVPDVPHEDHHRLKANKMTV